MNTHVRTAKGGSKRTISLDEASNARLAYCERAIAEHVRTKASFSSIVRRALVVYQEHLETLVRENKSLCRIGETHRLDEVNSGSNYQGITSDEVYASQALRTLHELSKEKSRGTLTIGQMIEQGVGEWRMYKPEEGSTADEQSHT